jgi:hypothetical protein
MLRTKILLMAVLASLCVAAAVPATAGAGDAGDNYRAYALVRERLISCSLDRNWRQLAREARARCVRTRHLYVLWADPGESYRYHVHCRTTKCMGTPEGEPDARAPIPSGARTFR